MATKEFKLQRFQHDVNIVAKQLGFGNVEMIENNVRESTMRFRHTMFANEIESIKIPAVKVPKNLWNSILEKHLPAKLKFLVKYKVIREELEINIRQFFPALIIPDGYNDNQLYIVASMRTAKGEKSLGHTSITKQLLEKQPIDEYGKTSYFQSRTK